MLILNAFVSVFFLLYSVFPLTCIAQQLYMCICIANYFPAVFTQSFDSVVIMDLPGNLYREAHATCTQGQCRSLHLDHEARHNSIKKKCTAIQN